MKVSLDLTLDGLLRALRGRGHGLAEEIEARYRREAGERAKPGGNKPPARPVRGRRLRDDIARR